MNDALARRATRLEKVSHFFLVGAVAVLAAFLSSAATAAAPDANAAGAPSTDTDTAKDRPMNHYALIFRQRPGELTAEELDRRQRETRAWAETQNAAGHALDPRILTAESALLEPAGGAASTQAAPSSHAPSTGLPVTAILFVEARDLAEATAVARAHPALRFGASIEVRPWAAPPPRPVARP